MDSSEKHAWTIACGMYAFTPSLRMAWKRLLETLPVHLKTIAGDCPPPLEITFDGSNRVYRAPTLLLAHTCGYPYLQRWRRTHDLVAVPAFDLPGCEEQRYCSWFVCHHEDTRNALPTFRQSHIALNQADSHSGMNTLRYALKDLSHAGPFFRNVRLSGSHLESIRMVARKEVALAAIDAVSFHHALLLEPDLRKKIRIFGQSEFATGLPFIHPKGALISASELILALNLALSDLPDEARNTLRIREFSPVNSTDYAPILEMEQAAITAGYPDLR